MALHKKEPHFHNVPGVYNRYACHTSYQEFDENPVANTWLEMSR
jgi:hypothetical protein